MNHSLQEKTSATFEPHQTAPPLSGSIITVYMHVTPTQFSAPRPEISHESVHPVRRCKASSSWFLSLRNMEGIMWDSWLLRVFGARQKWDGWELWRTSGSHEPGGRGHSQMPCLCSPCFPLLLLLLFPYPSSSCEGPPAPVSRTLLEYLRTRSPIPPLPTKANNSSQNHFTATSYGVS